MKKMRHRSKYGLAKADKDMECQKYGMSIIKMLSKIVSRFRLCNGTQRKSRNVTMVRPAREFCKIYFLCTHCLITTKSPRQWGQQIFNQDSPWFLNVPVVVNEIQRESDISTQLTRNKNVKIAYQLKKTPTHMPYSRRMNVCCKADSAHL